MAALGDRETAESHYREALKLAYNRDDPEEIASSIERLEELRGVEEPATSADNPEPAPDRGPRHSPPRW